MRACQLRVISRHREHYDRLTKEQLNQGLRELKPTDRVVTAAPVELQAALEELQNKAKAERKQ